DKEEEEYISWREIKETVFNLIKGNRQPLSFSFIFH
ncbi:MAG: DUF5721 family protein, partial [Lachnospiraceae bacterium]|nr:DUF5721 family protein [Lachnospiraceae bacterium]